MPNHDAVGIDDQKPTVIAGLTLVKGLVSHHPGPFVASIVGAATFAAGTVISARVLGWVVDEVIIGNFERDVSTADNVIAGVAAILAAAFLRSVGVVARRFFAGMTSERVERKTREELARQYLRQPMSWLRSVPTGRLMAHVDSDSHTLTHALHPFPFSVGVIFLAVFAGISLFVIDPWVAGVAFVLFPVMTVANSIYSRVVRQPLADVQQGVADIAGIAHESYEGALIVKTLGRRQAEIERFGIATQKLRKDRARVSNVRAVLDVILESLPRLGILSVVVMGAFRIRAGTMTAGDIIEVSSLFAALAMPMMVFGFLLESLIPSVVAWNRLRPVVEADLPVKPASTAPLVGPVGVVVERLTFAYPDAPNETVLREVSLSVRPGEMVAVVGPTGSGKSTLCSVIGGAIDGFTGEVSLAGRPIQSLSPPERSQAVALVFQEPFLFAESIRSNIDLDNRYSDSEVTQVAKVAAVDSWITSLPEGYETLLGERGVTVSGGQRQRIALARALVRNSGLVILDDATSAVDTVIEQQILSHLRGSSDATMFVVANRLSTIDLADRVIYMRDGRVVASGGHQELLERSDYNDLVMAYAEAEAS